MKVVTYEGIVENGCVHVAAGITLPEKAKVYIIIPDTYEVEIPPVCHIRSPRLANQGQAKDFIKEVVDVDNDADAER